MKGFHKIAGGFDKKLFDCFKHQTKIAMVWRQQWPLFICSRADKGKMINAIDHHEERHSSNMKVDVNSKL